MLSQANLKMTEPTQFKCDKCQVYFKRKEGLEKHLIKKFKCSSVSTDVPINPISVSTNIPTSPIPVPTNPIPVSTNIPTNPTPISTNNNDIMELKEILLVLVNEIRTLKEEVAGLKIICSTNPIPVSTNPIPVSTNPIPVSTNPTPISTNIPTNITPVPTNPTPISTNISTNPTPVFTEIPEPVIPIKKVKRVKKQPTEQPKTKQKFTYIPSTDDKDYADLDPQDQDTQETDIQICPELKSYLDNLNEKYKNSISPIELASKQIYFNNDNIFEYNKDLDKNVICEEELEGFIEKCGSVETQLDWYFQLFKRTLNFQTGFYLDKQTNRLYSVGENGKWDWCECKIANKLRCGIYDTINSAVANSAVLHKTYTDKLFTVKRLNYTGDNTDEINEKLCEMLKSYYQETQKG